jgi:ribosomal protein S18 acetylase RimI-like enzyme
MILALRPAVSTDADACGRVIYAAFKDIDERHGFTALFTKPEHATNVARTFIDRTSMHSIVAEEDGRLVGAVFVDEGDPIKSVALIAVEPGFQRRGVGRRLMTAAIERAGPALGVRLVQEAFNTHAMGLYVALGFEVKEPLAVMVGRPRSRPPAGIVLKPLAPADLEECATLCRRVHGIDRSIDLRDAMKLFAPTGVVRGGRIVAYTYLVFGGGLAWGVAETHDDLEALLLALGASAPAPLRFNVPSRDTRLFRWCLSQGMRIDRPLTLMARGWYQEPRGPYLPSGFY